MSDVPEKRRTHLSKEEKAVLVRQVASRAAVGESINSMAAYFNLSRGAVNRILVMPETQETIKKICDDAVQTAKNLFKARAEELAPKAFAAINALLDSENGRDKAEGVKLFFRTVGLDKLEEATGTGTLIINMPGSGETQEKVVEAEYAVQDSED